MTTRLIETWLPIAELSEESVRERRSMTALPPIYYLHVWWARRPLVASRAAVLASLLPGDADQARFLRVLGIHGDPVASRKRINTARQRGERFEGEAYSYPRAFSYSPTESELDWVTEQMDRLGLEKPAVLDPTAGGGSIPFEAVRLRLPTFANDLNPVAVLVERLTIQAPLILGNTIVPEFRRLADCFLVLREERLKDFFPPEPESNAIPTNFIWARTITCPYCEGVIPLSPNWRLAPDGTGVRIKPNPATHHCEFEIVHSVKE